MDLRPTSHFLSLAVFLTASCSAEAPPGPRGPAPEMQLALSGFQSDIVPGRPDRLGLGYTFASDDTLKYFSGKHILTYRLPMLWERLQPAIGGPLDPGKLADLDAFMDRADSFGVHIIPDLHAFGRRNGLTLGSPQLPISAFVSFWSQFAAHYKGRMAGYDIMNEPHDMPSPQVWPQAAQATVDAIRKVDTDTPIYVEGDDWSYTGRWQQSNANLSIHDPARKIIYSAHVYFDQNTSGQYSKSFDDDGASPVVGPQRLEPFTVWLRAHGYKGHIGEFGVPFDDPRWLPVLDSFLDAVRSNGDVLTGASYWMAGDWADRYALTLQPATGSNWADRPQLHVLMKPR
jgi:endoglucanase